MSLLPLVTAPGSTAEMRLTQLNPTDPTFEHASTLFYSAGVMQKFLADKEDEVTDAKNTVLMTTAEINKNNALSENLRLRQQIVESNWPIDPTLQAELIGLLEADAAIPPPQPVPSGSFYVNTLDELNASTARAQEILDKLNKAQADADAGLGAVAPLPAQPTSGGYALDQAVTDWLTAQGLQASGTDWQSAIFLRDGEYVSESREQLTQGDWTFPVPGVLTNPFVPSDVYYLAMEDGSIQRGEVQPGLLLDSVAELKAAGYDTSFIPDLAPGLPFPTQQYGTVLVKAGGTTYAVHSPALVEMARTGTNAGLKSYFNATYGTIVPTSGLGVVANGIVYWSDGSTVYAAAFLTDLDYSAPAGTVSALNTGAGLARYLANKGVIDSIDRLMLEGDVNAVSGQFESQTKTITTIVNQWANTADAENLRLKSTYNDYSVYMTYLTGIIEKIGQILTNVMPR